MKKFITLLMVIVVSVAALQCGDPDYPTPVPVVTALSSKLTVIHALASGPRLKIKMDNKITEKDTVRYEPAGDGKTYNTITLAVPAGPNRLINYANFADNANLVTDRYNATANTNNTAFFIQTAGATTTKVRRVADDLALPDPGLAKIRFLHFGYDVGEVKVTDVGGATTIFSARKYDEVTRGSTDFTRFTTPLTAGTYTLEVRATADDAVLLTINNLKLDSKGIYTIYLKGTKDGVDDDALSYGVFKH